MLLPLVSLGADKASTGHQPVTREPAASVPSVLNLESSINVTQRTAGRIKADELRLRTEISLLRSALGYCLWVIGYKLWLAYNLYSACGFTLLSTIIYFTLLYFTMLFCAVLCCLLRAWWCYIGIEIRVCPSAWLAIVLLVAVEGTGVPSVDPFSFSTIFNFLAIWPFLSVLRFLVFTGRFSLSS